MDHRYEKVTRVTWVESWTGSSSTSIPTGTVTQLLPKTPRTLLEHVDEWGHQTGRTWLTWPLCDLLEVRYLRDFLPHPWRYVARERLTKIASIVRLQG